MRINYPIKYAAMPIIEQVGWSHGLHELEREYDVVCYIVSKCHLISDSTKYTKDGRSVKQYEVVFPYQPGEFNRWERNIPTYNAIHGYCTNSNKVDAVFNSYEEALDYTKNKNEKLCENSCQYLSVSENMAEKIQEKKDEFDAKLEKYKVLEQQIALRTNDIEIKENNGPNNVIRIKNNSGKILSCSIYEVLELFGNDKFVIYNISQEQYNNLTKLISEEKTDDIKSAIGHAEGLVTKKSIHHFIKLAKPTQYGNGAYYYENNRILYNPDFTKVEKDDFENIDEDTLVFYTTETIEDLYNSYEPHSAIDLDQIQGPVLKKVKKDGNI